MNLFQLAQAFDQRGFSLIRVGGCVRDSILNRENHDIDCCTNANPDQILSLIRECGLSASLVGVSFGVVITTVAEGEIQIATFRGDDAGRNPEVTFTSTFEEDSCRRDLTINAIGEDIITGQLIDPQNGAEDIANRVIRAVGNPQQRIADDPLRILRVVRFAAQLGFTVEPTTAAACAENAQLLSTISRERVQAELAKILVSDRPSLGLRLLRDLGLLAFVSPEVAKLVGCLDLSRFHSHQPDVFEHTLAVVENVPNDLTTRLAALFHDIGKPATRTEKDGITHFIDHEVVGAKIAKATLEALKFDNTTAADVSKIVRLHMRRLNSSNKTARRLVADAGNVLVPLLNVMAADANDTDNGTSFNEFRNLVENAPVATALVSPLDGKEIMLLTGLPAGKAVGAIKNALTNAVIDGTVCSKNDAVDFVLRIRETL